MNASIGQLIVVALGGNAISQSHEEGRVDQQFANSRKTAKSLADLIEQGNQLVITHGNGPQIGNFLLRNDAAAGAIYPLPMEVALAHVQGGMGFMIAQTLTNELYQRGHDRTVAALMTTVLVDRNDPAFADPTKPIGRFLDKAEADQLSGAEGWVIKEIKPAQYRRVVPSPKPVKIMEMDNIRRGVGAGALLVACGGGGIPVIRREDGELRCARAVIDKDLVSALLAAELDADALIILTDVERVCLNFGKPDEQMIERMTVSEATAWLGEGQFPAGSMGPKIRAAIDFLNQSKNSRARVYIGPQGQATEILTGKVGTCISR